MTLPCASPRLRKSVWLMQLRLQCCVSIWDTSLPHTPKCRHPSLPVVGRSSRRGCFGRGAVEAELALLRIVIDEVKRSAEDLVGANGCPFAQIGGRFDPE